MTLPLARPYPPMEALTVDAIPVGSEWQSVDLPLQAFVEPVWSLTGVDLEDCLSRADQFGFGTTYNLHDGERAAATLLLDDILFR